jgi:hypothetical protein
MASGAVGSEMPSSSTLVDTKVGSTGNPNEWRDAPDPEPYVALIRLPQVHSKLKVSRTVGPILKDGNVKLHRTLGTFSTRKGSSRPPGQIPSSLTMFSDIPYAANAPGDVNEVYDTGWYGVKSRKPSNINFWVIIRLQPGSSQQRVLPGHVRTGWKSKSLWMVNCGIKENVLIG